MLLRSSFVLLALILLLSVPAMAGSVMIGYSVTGLGGSSFQYDYWIYNDDAGFPVQLFDIYFDPTLYLESSLTATTPPPLSTQWDQMFLHSVPPLGAAYDALANAGGIAEGSFVYGFEVQFTWLGQGLPGPQPFEIYDSDRFELLQSGTTQGPEPSFFGLVGLAIAYGGWKLRRAR